MGKEQTEEGKRYCALAKELIAAYSQIAADAEAGTLMQADLRERSQALAGKIEEEKRLWIEAKNAANLKG